MTDTSQKARAPLREAPKSPHLQVWRWHITMWTSILHRATGVALYGGALIIAGWALALAFGPDAYAFYKGLLGSLLGKVVMFGLTISAFYHLANGIRHLFWDAGKGFEIRQFTTSGWVVVVLSFVLTASLVLLLVLRAGWES